MGKRNLSNNGRHALEKLFMDIKAADLILAEVIKDGQPMPTRTAIEARILRARLQLAQSCTFIIETHPQANKP